MSALELEIQVNGESCRVPAGTTVEQLLRRLGIQAPRVAVERNRALVRKTEFAATALTAGDTVEIVTFVGGG